ncbi:MAG: aminotransferase class III-fold pyridoxal phosphate-dependent enzyme [Bacteroidota bacterium]|nr:aminotransferase class III-fold pyridoxal phosphate-dependent enzyme [Bacteroidota bacterium]
MKTFEVYPLFDIEPVKALGSNLWDVNGQQYLDLYGGHAVISIGHSHPYYIQKIEQQLRQIGFYSNSVKIPLQEELANKLGEQSGYPEYELFLCNSGAEANENAFKLASFHTGKKKIIAFNNSFHGRTSLAVEATDDAKICAPVNQTGNVIFLPLNEEAVLESAMNEEIGMVIIEGIQGVGGVNIPTPGFLQKIRNLCNACGAIMIVDEVQSGYGRSGKFFAHQYANIKPDLITVAKGMGNGFPVAGVLISPKFKAKHGILGTTFGGNYLACAAAIAVLDVIKKENLPEQAKQSGNELMHALKQNPLVKEVRGKGLMIGIEFDFPCHEIRKKLLFEHHIFTGSASHKNTLRILPALNITQRELAIFLEAFEKVTHSQKTIS